jgi:Domain of unknown function (DUF4160)
MLASRREHETPTISVFHGLIIRVYWNDHAPPHFHAIYADFEAHYAIHKLEVLRGGLPSRAHPLVLEWAALYRTELMEDWQLCESRRMPKKIKPLV